MLSISRKAPPVSLIDPGIPSRGCDSPIATRFAGIGVAAENDLPVTGFEVEAIFTRFVSEHLEFSAVAHSAGTMICGGIPVSCTRMVIVM